MSEKKDVFNTLNAIDISAHIKEKNGFSFLSWPYAWGEVKKHYPRSFYTIYETPDGMNYFTDGNTCWVKTGVTVIDGDFSLEHIEALPIMDHRNNSIPKDKVTSTDVNKTIQRSLTKACARHGLGLYIYAGEDLPLEVQEKNKAADEAKTKETQKKDAELKALRKTVIDACKGIIKQGVPQDDVYKVIRELNDGNANPNSIKDVALLQTVLESVSALSKTEET